MTKTQSRQFQERAEQTARYVEDTGDFSPEVVEAAKQVAAAFATVRAEYGYE